MKSQHILLVAVVCGQWVACAGEGAADPEQELDVYACSQTVSGDLVDGAATRATARSITIGRAPFRVNLLQDQANFVVVTADDEVDVTLFLDHPSALVALWQGESRTLVDNSEVNEFCPGSIPERITLTLSEGPHHLELGPVEQAAVWLLVGDRS